MVNIEDEDFYFSNYLNNSGSKDEDPSAVLDNNLGNSHNLINKNNKDTFIRGNNDSNVGSGKRLISDDEDNNAQLMLDLEKAK